jgi:SAM-dependent methyltransferase
MLQGIRPGYAAMTSRYDDELWELVPADPGPPPAHLAGFVRSLGPVERALDVGCGDGRLTAELRADTLTAADVSAVALERAGARLPEAELVELDPDAPFPFADAAFDLVLCAETVEHVRDVQLFLSEIRRVLRPGGELALTTPWTPPLARPEDPLSPHLRRFTRGSLRRVLGELGFELRSLERRSGTLLARAAR